MFQEVAKLSSAKGWQKMCLGELPSTGVGSRAGPDAATAAGSLWECWAHKGAPLGGPLFNQLGILDKLSQEKY